MQKVDFYTQLSALTLESSSRSIESSRDLDELFRMGWWFIQALPMDIQKPSIDQGANHEIYFRWNDGSNSLKVRFSKDGQLKFSAIKGNKIDSGEEHFSGSIPLKLVELLRPFHSNTPD